MQNNISIATFIAAVMARNVDGQVVPYKTGGRGRPSTATPEDVGNNYKANLNAPARLVAEKYPVETLNYFAGMRRALTPEEQAALSKTKDAKYQSFQNGEPAQMESRIVANVDCQGQSLGEAVMAVAEAVAAACIVKAKRSGTMHFISFERWAVARPARSAKPGQPESEDSLPATLVGMPSLYQGAVYASDAVFEDGTPTKKGFIQLARVYPDGSVEWASAITALPEVKEQVTPVSALPEAPLTEVPDLGTEAVATEAVAEEAPPPEAQALPEGFEPPVEGETKAQRDARTKRNKRREAKAVQAA